MTRTSLYLFLLLQVIIHSLAVSQSHSFQPIQYNRGTANWANKIRYPAEAIKQNISGKVILKLKILASGSIDSLSVIESSSVILTEACIDVVLETNGHWKAAQLNGQPIPYNALIVIDFFILNEREKAKYDYYQASEKYYNKRKFQKALSEIEQAIFLDAYEKEYIALRSKIKSGLGDKVGSEADQEKFQFLEKEVIEVISITGFTTITRRRVN